MSNAVRAGQPTTFRRKRTPEVTALRWCGPTGVMETGEQGATLPELAAFGVACITFEHPSRLQILAGPDGCNGYIHVPEGHWILKASDVDFYPVDPAYLDENFEVA
jgi:hypothetical protein